MSGNCICVLIVIVSVIKDKSCSFLWYLVAGLLQSNLFYIQFCANATTHLQALTKPNKKVPNCQRLDLQALPAPRGQELLGTLVTKPSFWPLLLCNYMVAKWSLDQTPSRGQQKTQGLDQFHPLKS